MNNSLSMPQFRDCLTKKLQSKPWITKGILRSVNAKNKICRKYCRTKIENKKEELYNSFKFHRIALSRLTRLSKANHDHSYFEESKNKIIKIWDDIREIIHISKKSSQSIKNLDVNGCITGNPKIISNTINKFFCEIPKKIENEIFPTANKYHDHLLNPSDNSFFI